jgi:hypothetical protein
LKSALRRPLDFSPYLKRIRRKFSKNWKNFVYLNIREPQRAVVVFIAWPDRLGKFQSTADLASDFCSKSRRRPSVWLMQGAPSLSVRLSGLCDDRDRMGSASAIDALGDMGGLAPAAANVIIDQTYGDARRREDGPACYWLQQSW